MEGILDDVLYCIMPLREKLGSDVYEDAYFLEDLDQNAKQSEGDIASVKTYIEAAVRSMDHTHAGMDSWRGEAEESLYKDSESNGFYALDAEDRRLEITKLTRQLMSTPSARSDGLQILVVGGEAISERYSIRGFLNDLVVSVIVATSESMCKFAICHSTTSSSTTTKAGCAMKAYWTRESGRRSGIKFCE